MPQATEKAARWLLLTLRLPTSRSSERVSVWRQLKRCGALALRSAGCVPPNIPSNREHFEWLSSAIRGYRGQAAIAEVKSFDDVSTKDLEKRFRTARETEYAALTRELVKRRKVKQPLRSESIRKLRHRFSEISAADFFGCPEQGQVEKLFASIESLSESKRTSRRTPLSPKDYVGRVWMTRPRPGIDRAGSAWLIRRFIDAKARFVFGSSPEDHPNAIPFDMYGGVGFGHEGPDCTYETIVRPSRSKIGVRYALPKRFTMPTSGTTNLDARKHSESTKCSSDGPRRTSLTTIF
jgi:hypothetical protein